MGAAHPTRNRHPELVSGSIVPLARWPKETEDDSVLLPNNTSACVAKWTLKQVQGDELGLKGEWANV